MNAKSEVVFKEGDLCVIRVIKKDFFVQLSHDGVLHTNKGYIRHSEIIGKMPGTKLYTNLNKPAYVFRPALKDFINAVKRHTTVSYPKEIAWIIYYTGVSNGSVVLEAGTGSGLLTMSLAYFVKPEGRVVSYEQRAEFSEIAAENVSRVGLDKYVEFRSGDVSSVPENDYFDACVLDLPEPWSVVDSVWRALKPGSPLIIFLPTVNQVERTVLSLHRYPFTKPETIEIFMRYWDVKEKATRPEFEMRGHTGFLIQTVKLLSEESDE